MFSRKTFTADRVLFKPLQAHGSGEASSFNIRVGAACIAMNHEWHFLLQLPLFSSPRLHRSYFRACQTDFFNLFFKKIEKKKEREKRGWWWCGGGGGGGGGAEIQCKPAVCLFVYIYFISLLFIGPPCLSDSVPL